MVNAKVDLARMAGRGSDKRVPTIVEAGAALSQGVVAATAGRSRSVTRKTATASVDSNEARKLLKREPVTSTGQIVDGQISY